MSRHANPHSFLNLRLPGASGQDITNCSHRRHNSEPLMITGYPAERLRVANLSSRMEKRRTCLIRGGIASGPPPDRVPALAPPAPVTVRLKPQYSIRRPRPNTEIFGLYGPPEIVLGEPKEHVGHPKTFIGQPALKLAAIKERMEQLEATNERLQHRIESCNTDAEMLSSSVTYFSSEYYAGLLTIRDLRARSRQDAEIMNNQEQQLFQLKKFVGLMIEIGLHEPVLERAHGSVLAGKNFEPDLVEAIRTAASRRGSAWAGILWAVNTPLDLAQPVPETDVLDVFESRESTVDDLLKSLKNGDIPSGRHRSATVRFSHKSPLRHRPAPPKNSLPSQTLKRPAVPISPRSPVRSVLAKLDVNRSPCLQSRKGAQKGGDRQLPGRSHKAVPRTISSTNVGTAWPVEGRQAANPPNTNTLEPVDTGAIPFSTGRALASLQRILDNFSSGSIGSLGTTTEGSQSADCDATTRTPGRPTSTVNLTTAPRSPAHLSVRPAVSCTTTTKAASPARRARHLTAIPSPASKSMESGSPPGQRRRTSDSGTAVYGNQSRKGGWR
ncbi:hypothetical protein B0H15DRAFT_179432 [Mycena belliarum]|uniref:Uncharacterized protein n=1 Tax=Mycena belliarum TaxID=1033014 RepID=A0AAD6UB08_9AGAR|nr:hypothetical protein B0H15DRAFT_179432 [Mycena belliae]